MEQTKRELTELAQRRGENDSRSLLGAAAYYRTLATTWRQNLDGVLQRYYERRHTALRAHPWKEFAKKVDAYLEDKLKHTVTIRTRASKAHATPLRRKGHELLRLLRGSLEATGTMPALAVTSGTPEGDAKGNVLRKEGTMWTLRYAGKTIHVTDSAGLRLIAALVQAQGKPISAVNLRGIAAGPENVPRPGSSGPPLSREDMAEYKRQLANLKDRLAKAMARGDHSHAAELSTQIGAIKGEIRKATGLRGRPRSRGDDAERARQAVCAAIARALKMIDREHHDLWRHLKNSLRLGALCAYTPDSDPGWRF